MFWHRIAAYIPDRLEHAVETGYTVFAEYERNGTIVYCDCPVCMTAETAHQLSTLPLREIPATLLAEYTNSAHGYDHGQIETEFKALLPRYLDCLANCEPPHDDSIDTCLSRLSHASYATRWPDAERDAINAFFDAYLAACLFQLGLDEWPAGYWLSFDVGQILNMVAIAGGDIDRLLNEFDRGPDPEAAVHMASLRRDVRWRNGAPYWHSYFLEGDHADVSDRVGAWLMRDSVTERILAAPAQLEDPDFDHVIEIGLSAARD